MGEDVSEMLEYMPASFKVIRHVRPKLSCTKCDVIVEAPAPSRPIDRGLAGPGLLAHVLVSKYSDHLPLYRQSEIYARAGIEIDFRNRVVHQSQLTPISWLRGKFSIRL
jgi:transposase